MKPIDEMTYDEYKDYLKDLYNMENRFSSEYLTYAEKCTLQEKKWQENFRKAADLTNELNRFKDKKTDFASMGDTISDLANSIAIEKSKAESRAVIYDIIKIYTSNYRTYQEYEKEVNEYNKQVEKYQLFTPNTDNAVKFTWVLKKPLLTKAEFDYIEAIKRSNELEKNIKR